MNVTVPLPAWLQKNGSEDLLPQAPAWLVNYRQQHWAAFLKNGLPSRKDERWKYSDLGFLANQNYSAARQINMSSDCNKSSECHSREGGDPFKIDSRLRGNDMVDLTDAIHQHRLQKGDSILLVMINGYFMPELSDLAKLPENVIACGMSEALHRYEDNVKANLPDQIDAQKYPFGSLNAAMFVDGLFLDVPEACELSAPIHLLLLSLCEEEFISHPYNMIIMRDNSKLTLLEEHVSFADHAYMMNIVTTINVGENAKLEHYKIQHEGKKAAHMANIFIRQRKNSSVSHVNFSSGSLFARDDLVIKLLEAGADCHTGGFYHLRADNQTIDNHVDIDHAAPHSNSDMLYKGIIDKKSRAIFNGRLYVEKDAQKILAYQANHNLLLSSEAEVYSKPELEIYADDVKCKHGATTGQIDQDALFYMRSRGIPHEEAMSILLQGFAEEILQRVTHAGIKLRVEEML